MPTFLALKSGIPAEARFSDTGFTVRSPESESGLDGDEAIKDAVDSRKWSSGALGWWSRSGRRRRRGVMSAATTLVDSTQADGGRP